LQLLAKGKIKNEGSRRGLKITTRMIDYHKNRMMKVLGEKSGAEIVKYAVPGRRLGRVGTRRGLEPATHKLPALKNCFYGMM